MSAYKRRIAVELCPTATSSCFEGFCDDHFAVTLKPFSGERGIRTPGTSQFNGFQDRRNRPLCHLSWGRCHWYLAITSEPLVNAKIVLLGEYASWKQAKGPARDEEN